MELLDLFKKAGTTLMNTKGPDTDTLMGKLKKKPVEEQEVGLLNATEPTAAPVSVSKPAVEEEPVTLDQAIKQEKKPAVESKEDNMDKLYSDTLRIASKFKPNYPKPVSLVDTVDKFNKDTEKQVGDLVKPYQDQLSILGKQVQVKLDEQKDEQAKAKWASIAEKVVHGLVQAAAGAYGMAKGIDVGGMKFDKTNWEDQLNNKLSAIRNEIDAVEAQKKTVASEAKDKQQMLRELREKVLARSVKETDKADTQARQDAEKQSDMQKQIFMSLASRDAARVKEMNRLDLAAQKNGDKKAEAEAKANRIQEINQANKEIKLLDSAYKTLSKTGDVKQAIGSAGAVFGPALEEGASKPGLLWGTNLDKEQAANFIEKTKAIKQAKLDALIAGHPSEQESAPKQEVAIPAGTVKMRHPNGELRAVPIKDQKAAEAAGYTAE